MDPTTPSTRPLERFSKSELDKCRKEFRDLQGLLDKCNEFSKGLAQGKADFHELLYTLCEIDKNSMYQFLSKQDPALKSCVELLYWNLKKCGGILHLGMETERKESKEKEFFQIEIL